MGQWLVLGAVCYFPSSRDPCSAHWAACNCNGQGSTSQKAEHLSNVTVSRCAGMVPESGAKGKDCQDWGLLWEELLSAACKKGVEHQCGLKFSFGGNPPKHTSVVLYAQNLRSLRNKWTPKKPCCGSLCLQKFSLSVFVLGTVVV